MARPSWAVRRSDGLIERQRHVGGTDLDRLRHVFGCDAKTFGQLRHCRFAAQLVLHLLVDAHHRLMQLLEAAGKTDGGALVAKVALDLSRHRQGRERRELEPEVGVEALDGLDQAEVADLHDVIERLASILKLTGEEVDEVVIRVHKLGADAVALSGVRRLFVATMERPQLFAGRPRLRRHVLTSHRGGQQAGFTPAVTKRCSFKTPPNVA